MKKRVVSNLILILCIAALSNGETGSTRTYFLIESGSTLSLNGTSTFHDYECNSKSVDGTIDCDTSGLASNTLGAVFIKGTVNIKVASLRSSSNGITENMQEALKGDDYPTISFVLTQCDTAPVPKKKSRIWKFNTVGNLTIAGKTHSIKMVVSLTNLQKGEFRLQGSHDLTMTDYGVDPPSFMLGVMQTNPKVSVYFDLKLAAK